MLCLTEILTWIGWYPCTLSPSPSTVVMDQPSQASTGIRHYRIPVVQYKIVARFVKRHFSLCILQYCNTYCLAFKSWVEGIPPATIPPHIWIPRIHPIVLSRFHFGCSLSARKCDSEKKCPSVFIRLGWNMIFARIIRVVDAVPSLRKRKHDSWLSCALSL